jgi:hypothetical protein
MQENNENQKPVTDAYRNAWDRIFKEKDGSLTINVEKGETNEYTVTRDGGESLQNDSGSV